MVSREVKISSATLKQRPDACIFNEGLLFCINLEFLGCLHATACILTDCETGSASFFVFLINPPMTHMGTPSFLLCREAYLLASVRPFRGCIHSVPVCQALCNH